MQNIKWSAEQQARMSRGQVGGCRINQARKSWLEASQRQWEEKGEEEWEGCSGEDSDELDMGTKKQASKTVPDFQQRMLKLLTEGRQQSSKVVFILLCLKG